MFSFGTTSRAKWLGLLVALIAACKGPLPPASTAPTAPSISGSYVPALNPPAPAAAVPTTVYTGYPDSYGVMLCINLDGANCLCWYPPA